MAEAGKAQRYRVVQWATGNIGVRALRVVIEHPQLDLVGLHVHSPDKEGRDAGELCGLPPIGVKATRDIEAVLAAKPDVVLYMQQHYDLDDICRLLAAGINIVTTRVEFHNPRMMDPAIRDRVEAACRAGNSSIHSSGASPGFVSEALPLVLTSIQRRLDCITIDEFADLSRRDSPDMLFNIMGYGKPPEDVKPMAMGDIMDGFYHSLGVVADAIGLPFDDVEVRQETATAREDAHILAGVVPKGTVAAHRYTVTGLHKGKPVLRQRLNWYCTTNIDADWELRKTGWRILVEGDTPLDIAITFPVRLEDYTATMPGYTAHRPVNAIPYVCAAPAGIRTSADLPQIIPTLG